MSVEQITEITDHAADAVDRLPQVYKDAPKTWTGFWAGTPDATAWETVLRAFAGPAQDLETVMNSMLNERDLDSAEGVNLDRIGQIVGEPRQGDTDEVYRDRIIGQIAENNSDGTAANLIDITTIQVDDELEDLIVFEAFPAKVRIYIFVNGTDHNPLSLVESLDSAKAAGVGLFLIRATFADYFGFSSDPSAKGFATLVLPGQETFASGNDGFDITTSGKEYCQSIEAVGDELISVTMNSFFNRFGTATGDLKLSLYSADGSDLPDTLIADSTNVIDLLTLDPGFGAQDSTPVTFNFASIAMTPGTTYCLVISVVGYGGANLGVCWREDNPYPNGFAGSFSGGSWNPNVNGVTTADFQMTIVESSTPVTLGGGKYSTLFIGE